MAKIPRDLSVSELERLLNDRQSEITQLIKRREKLQREMDQLDNRISQLSGGRTIHRTRDQGRSAVQRPKNERSLREVVTDILTKNKKGFPLAKLTDKVLAAGYRSSSHDFKNVLYQCLYNSDSVKHDEKTGHYMLVKK